MIEVEATHLTTTQGGSRERLVCELYPGVLVVDGGGVHSVQTLGRSVVPLPKKAGRTFPVPDGAAEEAAYRYDRLMQSAETTGRPWPPAAWLERAGAGQSVRLPR